MNKDVTRPTETSTYGSAEPPTTRRLSAIEDGKSAALQAEITQDAISKAERIMQPIDARWPSNAAPGKS